MAREAQISPDRALHDAVPFAPDDRVSTAPATPSAAVAAKPPVVPSGVGYDALRLREWDRVQIRIPDASRSDEEGCKACGIAFRRRKSGERASAPQQAPEVGEYGDVDDQHQPQDGLETVPAVEAPLEALDDDRRPRIC